MEQEHSPASVAKPLASLQDCAQGLEAPVDHERFNRMIEPLLSEVSNSADQSDVLVQAWLILIEAHEDGESALFLVDRLLRFIDHTEASDSFREQWLGHRMEARMIAGQRAIELGQIGMAQES